MRINHNIAALNTYNKLSANTAATSKSLEKLSSGLKINRAGDNAAGLAISEKMRGQISGLDTASANANDGISLIQTAEGALNETHSILQRMRELAVQSSNDTNTDSDRSEIQKEIDQLTSEVDRISNDTEFNTQKLLNGEKATNTTTSSFKNASGATKDSIIRKTSVDGNIATGKYTATVSVSDAKSTQATFVQTNQLTDANGAVSTITVSGGTTASSGTPYAGVIVGKTGTATGASGLTAASGQTQQLADDFKLSAGTYTLKVLSSNTGSGSTYSLLDSTGKTIDTAVGNDSGVASTTLNWVNSTHDTTLTAAASSTTATSTFTVTNGYSLDNGTTINATGVKDAATGITVSLSANAKVGDSFSLDVGAATGPTLDLKAADLEKGSYSLVVSDYNGTTATVTVQDSEGKAVKDADGKVIQKTGQTVAGAITIGGISITATSIKGNSTSDFAITQEQKATATLKDAVGSTATGVKFEFNDTVENGDTFTIDVDADNAMKFQIGANEGQSTSLSINEMSAKKLGIDKLDLTTQDGADAAITTIDKAITSVSSERAKLGAVQNRLEHTINNLSTSSENLSSAESRIRDVDMAKEMMNFTKNNILSQAAQSMLAQANQQPQGVLQLLQ